MNKYNNLNLIRAILSLEKQYPKDDLIQTYSDFLKVRDYLPYYEFNPVVFDKLINLICDNWASSKRISRLSLLQKMKQYLNQSIIKNNTERKIKPDIKLPFGTRQTLFKIFKKTFEEQEYISSKQLEEARTICNNTLINIALSQSEEEWLCSNFYKSDMILNRLLRYPIKSDVITNWIKQNFENDFLRNRRAECIGWLIDQNPYYEIDPRVLIDDFDYLNKSDLQAIQNYDDEMAANKILEQEFSDFLPKTIEYDLFDSRKNQEKIDLTLPELKLTKRPYSVVLGPSMHYPVTIPNFDSLQRDFHANLSIHNKVTMIWAIAYSRLENKQKFQLLKKYYCIKTHYSMFRVAIKTNNVAVLKWMLEQESSPQTPIVK
jgi:hypothetical protein